MNQKKGNCPFELYGLKPKVYICYPIKELDGKPTSGYLQIVKGGVLHKQIKHALNEQEPN